MKSEISFKVDIPTTNEITETGYLKTQILDELLKNEHITKKKDNVMVRLDNLLYEGVEIEKAYYDTDTKYVILHLKEKLKY